VGINRNEFWGLGQLTLVLPALHTTAMHRDGLSSRSHPSDQVQIHIGKGFDFDTEVDDLRKHVGRIKQVS
jgi:hypothetical protein